MLLSCFLLKSLLNYQRQQKANGIYFESLLLYLIDALKLKSCFIKNVWITKSVWTEEITYLDLTWPLLLIGLYALLFIRNKKKRTWSKVNLKLYIKQKIEKWSIKKKRVIKHLRRSYHWTVEKLSIAAMELICFYFATLVLIRN